MNEIDAFELPGGIILTGGAASLPGVVDLAQEVFETNVKLYVPNHMGLRNPVFTNVISIVDYSANLSEVYQLAKSAITGERTTQQPVAVQQEISYEQYEAPEETYEEPEEEKKGESITNRVKDFFSNIFE